MSTHGFARMILCNRCVLMNGEPMPFHAIIWISTQTGSPHTIVCRGMMVAGGFDTNLLDGLPVYAMPSCDKRVAWRFERKGAWPRSFLCHRIMALAGFHNTFLASCLSMTSHDGAGPGIKKMLLAPGLGINLAQCLSMPSSGCSTIVVGFNEFLLDPCQCHCLVRGGGS